MDETSPEESSGLVEAFDLLVPEDRRSEEGFDSYRTAVTALPRSLVSKVHAILAMGCIDKIIAARAPVHVNRTKRENKRRAKALQLLKDGTNMAVEIYDADWQDQQRVRAGSRREGDDLDAKLDQQDAIIHRARLNALAILQVAVAALENSILSPRETEAYEISILKRSIEKGPSGGRGRPKKPSVTAVKKALRDIGVRPDLIRDLLYPLRARYTSKK